MGAFLLVLLQVSLPMQPDVTVKESSLLVFAHGESLHQGDATMVVEVHNPSTDPVRLEPGGLDILDDKGERRGTCRYQRAVVWEGNDAHRRFTTFDGVLAPGERLAVKLFFAPEEPLPAALLRKDATLRLRATVGSLKLDGMPFRPQILDD